MNARTLVWLFAFCASAVIAGCGLTLDYGPPSTMDGSVADTGSGCASSCDDGLRCTADSCSAGTCQHNDTCTGNTDCVSRGGAGECRRACTSASDCTDDNPCTDDVCDPTDHHCAHVSTCPGSTPTCLETGACVPTHCSNDAECDDQNDCNGMEICSSGSCGAGTPVTCAPSTGCAANVCNPATGQCTRTLDVGSCDDSILCTSDVCNDDGTCSHNRDDTVCADADRCTSSACIPSSSPDATGCTITARSSCPPACGVAGVCDPTSGSCVYEGACPAGQVCTSTGCQGGTCTTSAECHGIHSPDGCQTVCTAGVCSAPACALPAVGSCARVDPTQCSSGVCHLIGDSSLCVDGDPLSTDVCNPATFTCVHSCPTLTDSCIGFSYVSGSCRVTRDPAFCAAAHPANATDCARSLCVGAPSTVPGDDGCQPVGMDALCADAIGCTDDTCTVSTAGVGTCSHTPNAGACSDGMDCTSDGCDPGALRGASGCTHTADDGVCQAAVGDLACATAYCAQTGTLGNMVGDLVMPTGCALRYTPTACTLMVGTICTLDGSCESADCGTLSACDDGVQCNGLERCDLRTGRCVQDPFVTGCPAGTGTSCQQVCLPTGCAPPQTPVCGVMTMTM